MQKRTKKTTLILLCALVLLIIVWVVYHIPSKTSLDMEMTSKSGEVVSVSFDISEQKYFFQPTRFFGEIMFDGKIYQSAAETRFNIYKSNSFTKNIKLKFEGFRYDWFVRKDYIPDLRRAMSDFLILDVYEDGSIMILSSSNNTTYYAKWEGK